MSGSKVLCRTPNQPDGGKGVHIDGWKFDALAAATYIHFQENGNDPMGFMDLIRSLHLHLDKEQMTTMGSIPWFSTTVVLELEFRGTLVAEKVRGKKMVHMAA